MLVRSVLKRVAAIVTITKKIKLVLEIIECFIAILLLKGSDIATKVSDLMLQSSNLLL